MLRISAIHKELGRSARFFNQSGKAQFNQPQISHAVLSFMARKEQQRHLTDLAIHEEDNDHDDDIPGSVRASQLPDNPPAKDRSIFPRT